MKKVILVPILFAVIVLSCTEVKREREVKKERNQIQSFINPPIEHIRIPFTEHIVNSEKGDTVFYNSGSLVTFPPKSFVDENGKIVKGDVKVLYREFNNPIDFFLSGIPMNYDSLGIGYNFESMGMVEISATQNGKPIYVNKENQPIINLASKINNGADNYYYLDTLNKEWVYKNKTEITDILKESDESDFTLKYNDKEIPKPRKKSERPSFNITIEPGTVTELSSYDNLSFEITEYEKNYKPEYGDILWENVIVEKSKRDGAYNVTFEKGTQKITFETWPVLSDVEYEKAIDEYKSKKRESDRKRDLINEGIEKKRIAFELERKKIEEYNSMIKVRNDSLMREIESIKVRNKNLIKEREIQKFVYSKFSIDRFGIWNCDKPILQQGPRLIAYFYTNDNEKIELEEFSVAYYDFNGIVKEKNQLTYLQNKKMKILAVKEQSFYYTSFDDFNDYSIDTKKNMIEIKLIKDIVPDNYSDLCKKVENNMY